MGILTHCFASEESFRTAGTLRGPAAQRTLQCARLKCTVSEDSGKQTRANVPAVPKEGLHAGTLSRSTVGICAGQQATRLCELSEEDVNATFNLLFLPQDIEYWQKLRNTVWTTDHIVDKLVFKDIQLTASNDDQYFVFEDVLYQVLLCFSRDADIANCVEYESFPVKGKTYEGPPSGVVPFHGICMFAAPFCYLYDSPVCLYFTFRAFYVRYCHRLTTINTHPQGIVSLCLLFEKLLQTYEPHLWSHFRELQIQP